MSWNNKEEIDTKYWPSGFEPAYQNEFKKYSGTPVICNIWDGEPFG